MSKVVQVEDHERALRFWIEALGFELHQDAEYGDDRWLEVRSPDGAVNVVLDLRHVEAPTAPEGLPTSNVSSTARIWRKPTSSFALAVSTSRSRP